jgi:hypothetical protein
VIAVLSNITVIHRIRHAYQVTKLLKAGHPEREEVHV